MNKILITVNALLVIAVGYLFYLVGGNKTADTNSQEGKEEIKKPIVIENKNVPVTGKIAFINIDQINEKSLFVMDMVKKLEKTKNSIEASLENLGMRYEEKVKDYQSSASAGIIPESELASKAKEIQNIEKDAQSKRLQMDNLGIELNEKNESFKADIKNLISEKYSGKFDYVLTYSENVPLIVYGNPSFDITEEVIIQINESYKSKKAVSKQ
ncbi:MAG: OmpH family outer membrane protein [Sphingobacteriaceae bacterium]|nr:OmpH family outer membrane protein [Sphingobacteriaceae bacterium]